MMKMPKGITSHPGVKECKDAEGMGFVGYKYNVLLKDGWVWANGRNAGFNMCNVESVSDFRYLKPIKAEDYTQ